MVKKKEKRKGKKKKAEIGFIPHTVFCIMLVNLCFIVKYALNTLNNTFTVHGRKPFFASCVFNKRLRNRMPKMDKRGNCNQPSAFTIIGTHLL